MSDKSPRRPGRGAPIGDRAGSSGTGNGRPSNKRGPARGNQPQGPRPEHPTGAATLLIIGVTLLIFLIAALSTFGGR